MRRLARLAASVGVLGCVLALAPAASAHHYTGTCGEVGEWTESASARLGEYVQTMGVLAYVGWIPPAMGCINGSNQYQAGVSASQHTSLHARRRDRPGYCLETVAQRWSFGLLRMYGYDCTVGDPDARIHDLWNYGSEWMYLWMASYGNPNWVHYYYRYDTNQWIYLGDSPQFGCCSYYQSWLESSGHNESSTRGTHFVNFTETRLDGSYGTSNFPCPVTEDEDRHQEEVPNAWGQAANSSWWPATTHSC